MRKLIFVIFVLLILSSGISQNLVDKQEQLSDLKRKILEHSKNIETKKIEKAEKESALDETSRKQKKTKNDLRKFQATEKKIKNELNNTEKKLQDTSSNLTDLNQLCGTEFEKLCYLYHQKMIAEHSFVDDILLADALLSTYSEIENFKNKKNKLEDTKKKEQKDFENAQWSRIVAKKKEKKYSEKIVTLAKNIDQIEKEREKAEQLKQKLEDEARALDELISKLRSDISAKHYSYKFSTPKLIWPLKGEIIRDFGNQKSEDYKVSLVNNGIDIRAEEDSEIVAVEDGIVAFAQWHEGSGKLIIIDHQNGFYSLYAHNSSLLVSKGDSVHKNQKIAIAGQTGNAETPSLHFELRKRGTPVDPLDYLE